MTDESSSAQMKLVVEIDDATFAHAYKRAMAYAQQRAKQDPEMEAVIVDAATDGVLWARQHCADAEKFAAFSFSAVKSLVWRRLAKARDKAARRPKVESLSEHEGKDGHSRDLPDRQRAPEQPLLIEDLPEELAFVVRLYMIDGFTIQEISLLERITKDEVQRRLRRAADILAEGRLTPTERKKGERRFTALGRRPSTSESTIG